MSYQSFLRSTSGSGMTGSASGSNNASSPHTIPRKSTAASSPSVPVSPNPPTSSIHNIVTRNTASSSNNAGNSPLTPASSVRSSALRSNPTNAPSSYQPNTPAFTPSPTTKTNTGTSTSAAAHIIQASPATNVASKSLVPSESSGRIPLQKDHIDAALRQCLALQKTATTLHEKRPFAALLLAPDNASVLLTHFSISHVQHAETELARLATIHFSQKYLANCTLVSTWEPCAMCTGTIYWSNIGRVVYAARESRLKDLTGPNNQENMTLALPCRTVLEAGQKDIEVIGPVDEWEDQVVEESKKWWDDHQAQNPLNPREGSIGANTRAGSLSSVSLQQGTPTTWTGEDSVLSSINDEGEYTADLDIDWMR